MDLQKLFEIQAGLDAYIVEEKGLEGQDLLDEKFLALKVEFGELANEQRTWKFWSEDREPRTEYICKMCEGSEEISRETAIGHPEHGYDVFEVDVNCPLCEDVEKDKNPLLEEYVDVFHFLLSIGNDLDFRLNNQATIKTSVGLPIIEITTHFNSIYRLITDFEYYRSETSYYLVLSEFLGLGEMLGLTGEHIEQAYFDKNKVNHERQQNGY